MEHRRRNLNPEPRGRERWCEREKADIYQSIYTTPGCTAAHLTLIPAPRRRRYRLHLPDEEQRLTELTASMRSYKMKKKPSSNRGFYTQWPVMDMMLSCVCVKNPMVKSHLGRRRFPSVYNLSSLTKGVKAGTWRPELMGDNVGVLLTDSHLPACPPAVIYNPEPPAQVWNHLQWAVPSPINH